MRDERFGRENPSVTDFEASVDIFLATRNDPPCNNVVRKTPTNSAFEIIVLVVYFKGMYSLLVAG
jgi:hypothetical protein